MNKEFLSMKDIAAELKTSKQRVYRCIKKHHIKEAHYETVNGNTVLMYDKEAFLKVSELLNASEDKEPSKKAEAHHEVHHETLNEALYEALLKQLELKDQQIEKLQQSLDQSQLLLDQAQKLHAMDKQRILELEDKAAAVPEEPEKKKWWFWK